MPQVTSYANKSAYLPYEYPNTNDHSSATFTPDRIGDIILIGFAAVPESIKFKDLDKVEVHLHGVASYITTSGRCFSFSPLKEEFNENTATYNNRPSIRGYTALACGSTDNAEQWYSSQHLEAWQGIYVCKYGISVQDVAHIDTSRSNYKPYIVITYRDDTVTASIGGMAPNSGYIPKT